MNDNLINVWQNIIDGDDKSWVLFEHGTCVILMEPEEDLAAQACELLQKWGPVHLGSSTADFSTITLDNEMGWVITCHHNDILTYIGHEEVGDNPEDLAIGMSGRSLRSLDAEALIVIHIEVKRQI